MSNAINIKNNKLSSGNIDWPLLLFIIGVVNVKTYVKIISIILYFSYIIFKKIPLTATSAGPLKFYIIIPFVGLISALICHSFSFHGYWFGYLFGLVQWLICAAAFYLLFCVVKNYSKETITKTVDTFFIVNIVASLLQLVMIMMEAKNIFPYWLNDSAGRFGVSTGDRLMGITFNNSINNSAISILGCIYFLFNEKLKLAIICILIMVLCTSNLSVLISLFTLVIIFVFIKRKNIRKRVVLITFFLLVLYPVVSFVNLLYINTIFKTFVLHQATKYENPDSFKVIGATPLAEKSNDSTQKPESTGYAIQMLYQLKVDNNDTNQYILRLKELKQLNDKYKDPNLNLFLDQSILKRSFNLIYGTPVEFAPLKIYSKPGKVYAFKQTFFFMKSNLRNLFFGAGMGNFSSKLAIKMTGLGLQGKYPQKYVYASEPFMENHMYTIFYYLCQNVALHSVLNMPNSVYNQIAGEYGIIGLTAFVILYIGYFWKNRNRSGYGKYLMVVLLLFFGVDYWFEMVSLTVIFELLMLMDIFAYTNNADRSTPGDSTDAGV